MSVALYSHLDTEKGLYDDIISLGLENVWICEFGSKALNVSYDNFKQNLMGSNVGKTFLTIHNKSRD